MCPPFKEHKGSFIAIKDEAIKDELGKMKNIPIGSWKKHNDYAWFTGHGNSFHTPTVDEIELHKIAVLIEKKTVLSYIKYCIS